MCVNDLVVQGAEPLFFLDYFATGKIDPDVAEAVVAGIAEGCRQAGCALIGGETAEMPGHYAGDDYDLAGFAVGAAERPALLTGDAARPGDAILGLASSGLHSNGYSLARRVVETGSHSYADPAPFADGETLAEALLTPTRIYVRACRAALDSAPGAVHGIAHITGGGLIENLPRVLPDRAAASIDRSQWSIPPVFEWLAASGGIEDAEMLRTFNCGIGMALVVAPAAADAVTETLERAGETVLRLGEVVERTADAVQFKGGT